MKKYKNAISNYVDKMTSYWPPQRWEICQENLKIWQSSRNKHETFDFFNYSDNRCIYGRILYGARVDCFYQILKETSFNKDITNILTSKSSVISFGCGPGPEIAAYISYVRHDLKCNIKMNILAIDCLAEWGTFINEIAGLDGRVTVQFQAGKLSINFLLQMKHRDVCVMSYPHAMNFENIWKMLKLKFSLIIFIDQRKGPLLQKMKSNGFQAVDFKCKGNKTFFYYVDPSYSHKKFISPTLFDNDFCPYGLSNSTKVLCPRQKHWLVSSANICKELLNMPLTCGHNISIHCFESDKIIKQCEEKVEIHCPRKVHKDFFALCGSICQQPIEIKLKCGHAWDFKCNEDENQKICNIFEPFLCSRGLHSKFSFCYSKVKCESLRKVQLKSGRKIFIKCYESEYSIEDDNKCFTLCSNGKHFGVGPRFICEIKIFKELPCKHLLLMKCFENELEKVCDRKLSKKCSRNLHDLSYKCSEDVRCEERCPVSLECGCSDTVPCHHYGEYKEKHVCPKYPRGIKSLFEFMKSPNSNTDIFKPYSIGELLRKRGAAKIFDEPFSKISKKY